MNVWAPPTGPAVQAPPPAPNGPAIDLRPPALAMQTPYGGSMDQIPEGPAALW